MRLVITPTMKRFLKETGMPVVRLFVPPDDGRICSSVTRALAYADWVGMPEDQVALGAPQVPA